MKSEGGRVEGTSAGCLARGVASGGADPQQTLAWRAQLLSQTQTPAPSNAPTHTLGNHTATHTFTHARLQSPLLPRGQGVGGKYLVNAD